jgi:transposase
MGRPLKLTKDLQTRLCKFLRQGCYREQAALCVGIGVSTFYRWMDLGEDQRRRVNGRTKTKRAPRAYREFREAVENAEAVIEALMVETVRRSAFEVQTSVEGERVIIKDWRAAAWFLERKARERWGPDPALMGGAGPGEGEGGGSRKTVVFGGRYKSDGAFLPPAPIPKRLLAPVEPEPAPEAARDVTPRPGAKPIQQPVEAPPRIDL